mmetsp:Transcript_11497/g.29211  ORF Transcript_11497/g.29211 Transcript_11497/m.29211 type:complete len:230 (+) Transcript_11497:250-939(+)
MGRSVAIAYRTKLLLPVPRVIKKMRMRCAFTLFFNCFYAFHLFPFLPARKLELLDESLPVEVHVCFFVEDIPVLVLELLVLVVREAVRLPGLDLAPQGNRLVDASHLVEDLVVGDAQAPHPVLVPVLLEVPLKGPAAPVAVVAADLALELLVQSVQLVQPVRDWLPVPAQWKLERVVHDVLVVVVIVKAAVSVAILLLVAVFVLLVFDVGNKLLIRARRLLLNVALCIP